MVGVLYVVNAMSLQDFLNVNNALYGNLLGFFTVSGAE